MIIAKRRWILAETIPAQPLNRSCQVLLFRMRNEIAAYYVSKGKVNTTMRTATRSGEPPLLHHKLDCTSRKNPCSKMYCGAPSRVYAFIPAVSPFSSDRSAIIKRHRAHVCCQGPSASVPKGSSASFPTVKNVPSSLTTGAPLRAAVLVSGGGRSLTNLCERIDAGTLNGVKICGVVSSKRKTGANGVAEQYGLPLHVIVAKEYADSDEHSVAVTETLDALRPDVVVMAGWMHFYRIPERYTGRVINIHPSLIPAFCGKGYYGMRVHRAVVSSTSVTLFVFPLLTLCDVLMSL